MTPKEVIQLIHEYQGPSRFIHSLKNREWYTKKQLDVVEKILAHENLEKHQRHRVCQPRRMPWSD